MNATLLALECRIVTQEVYGPEFAYSGVMGGAPCESSEVVARSASVGLVNCTIGIDITAESEAVYYEIGIVGPYR